MTIAELITGLIGLLSSWALACLLGFFIGLHVAGKEHKEPEDKEHDRSNL